MWTSYPRGSFGFGQLGPRLSDQIFLAGKPDTLTVGNSKAASKYAAPEAPFSRIEFSATSLRDAVYPKVQGPQTFFMPNLQPSANFSVSTATRNTEPINLREHLNDDTKDLVGLDLLNAIMRYLKKTDVYKLDAKEFESVLDATERLRLSSDPLEAKIKADYNQDISDDEFFKLELWLLATVPADPSIKRGFIKMIPGGANVPVTYLLSIPKWTNCTRSAEVRIQGTASAQEQ